MADDAHLEVKSSPMDTVFAELMALATPAKRKHYEDWYGTNANLRLNETNLVGHSRSSSLELSSGTYILCFVCISSVLWGIVGYV